MTTNTAPTIPTARARRTRHQLIVDDVLDCSMRELREMCGLLRDRDPAVARIVGEMLNDELWPLGDPDMPEKDEEPVAPSLFETIGSSDPD